MVDEDDADAGTVHGARLGRSSRPRAGTGALEGRWAYASRAGAEVDRDNGAVMTPYVTGGAAIACAVALVVSWRQDPRRLRNGVFAVLALALGAIAVLTAQQDDPGPLAQLIAVVALGVLPLGYLVLSVFLIANGLVMLRREGRSLGNLMSLLTGLAMAALPVLLVVVTQRERPTWFVSFVLALLLLGGYVGWVFACFAAYCLTYRFAPRTRRADALVVLGSRVIDGRVPPLLAARLDRAVGIYQRQRGEGHAPLVVPSGGQGPDESVPEGVAMAEYARGKGVDPAHLVVEDRARTTEENLLLSRALVQERRPGGRMLVVTNDYHVFRTALLARRLGTGAHVVGAPTARYYVPSAYLREFVAVVREHWRLHAVVAAIILAIVAAGMWVSLQDTGLVDALAV